LLVVSSLRIFIFHTSV